MRLTIICHKEKDFGFDGFSPYIKTGMIGIENVIQNTLNKDRTYDNDTILQIFHKYYLSFCSA